MYIMTMEAGYSSETS